MGRFIVSKIHKLIDYLLFLMLLFIANEKFRVPKFRKIIFNSLQQRTSLRRHSTVINNNRTFCWDRPHFIYLFIRGIHLYRHNLQCSMWISCSDWSVYRNLGHSSSVPNSADPLYLGIWILPTVHLISQCIMKVSILNTLSEYHYDRCFDNTTASV